MYWLKQEQSSLSPSLTRDNSWYSRLSSATRFSSNMWSKPGNTHKGDLDTISLSTIPPASWSENWSRWHNYFQPVVNPNTIVQWQYLVNVLQHFVHFNTGSTDPKANLTTWHNNVSDWSIHLLFEYQQGIFDIHRRTDRTVYTTTFVTSAVEHWLEREISYRIHHAGLTQRPIVLEWMLYHWDGRKEVLYLTMHSTHYIYVYMASGIWYRTTQIVREETRCHHMGYSFRLAARVLLYAPSHR